MNKINWENFRNDDGSLRLIQAFEVWVGPVVWWNWTPEWREGARKQIERIQALQPIKSRQVAALTLELVLLSSVVVVRT